MFQKKNIKITSYFSVFKACTFWIGYSDIRRAGALLKVPDKEADAQTLKVTGQHHKACTVYIDCHSSINMSQSQHAASRKHWGQDTVRYIWIHQRECTDHPKWEHSVFMLWEYACRLHVFTCMWCMHAGYVLYVCMVVCSFLFVL